MSVKIHSLMFKNWPSFLDKPGLAWASVWSQQWFSAIRQFIFKSCFNNWEEICLRKSRKTNPKELTIKMVRTTEGAPEESVSDSKCVWVVNATMWRVVIYRQSWHEIGEKQCTEKEKVSKKKEVVVFSAPCHLYLDQQIFFQSGSVSFIPVEV